MVQSDDLRVAFVARLKKALNHANIAEWGAGVRLAKIAGATPKAASKWMNAEAMPGRSNMQAIADELGVRVEWLQYGEGSMLTAENAVPHKTAESVGSYLIPEASRLYRYPMVSSVAAGVWQDAIQPFEPGGEDVFELTDYKAKGLAFWLAVEGDSMTWSGSPSIPEGHLILVDTGLEAKPGDLVVAKLDSEDKATFKKLVRESGQLYLKPLNPAYEPIKVDAGCRIIGVVKEAKLKL